jgi:hypothetical protein
MAEYTLKGPIEELLKKREEIMTFKALTGGLPQYLVKLFTRCQNNNYNLRSNQTNLELPKPKTNFLKRSFSYRAARSWNELSSETIENYNELLYQSYRLNGDYIIRYKIDANTDTNFVNSLYLFVYIYFVCHSLVY